MTVREIYDRCLLMLYGVENQENEARYIIEKVLSYSETDFLLNKSLEVDKEDIDKIFAMIDERLTGRPIQYILGEWDFYGQNYKVGEGVLIPRPETEELCEYIINSVKDIKNPIVCDLCSGSGCIGLTIKNNVPTTELYLIEKSLVASKYLRENAENICPEQHLKIIIGDVLNIEVFEDLPMFDVIVSNPPYIRSEEIKKLQKEVHFEPDMALDGGEDGLIFYRYICRNWTRYLKANGLIAFECGENQAGIIADMLNEKNFETEILMDFRGVDRFVIGRKMNNDI